MILRDNYEMYQSEVEHYTSQGYRLLVFGKYLGEFQETLAAEVQPLGYILLWNPIRKEAKATLNISLNKMWLLRSFLAIIL